MPAPRFGMLALRQVLLVRWGGPTRVADIEEMRRASRDLGAANPRGIAHMNLVDIAAGEARGLDEPSRAAIVRLLRDRDVPLRLSSVIFPQPGFQAAFVRAILGGLLFVSRTPAQARVHSSVRQGAEWIAAGLRAHRGDEPPEVGALVEGMERLRAER